MRSVVKSVCDLQRGDRTLSYEVIRTIPCRNGMMVIGKLFEDNSICFVFWKDIYHQIRLTRTDNCIDTVGELVG